jgi:hypothetical protein
LRSAARRIEAQGWSGKMRRRDAQATSGRSRSHVPAALVPGATRQSGRPGVDGPLSCAHKTPGGIRWRVFAIYEWHVRADLGLLSACQTSVGRGMRRRSFYPGAGERFTRPAPPPSPPGNPCTKIRLSSAPCHWTPFVPQGDRWLALWRIQSACRTGTRAEVFADPTRPAREVIACRL